MPRVQTQLAPKYTFSARTTGSIITVTAARYGIAALSDGRLAYLTRDISTGPWQLHVRSADRLSVVIVSTSILNAATNGFPSLCL